jgi:phytanoyl-CoA hydroxylase
MLTRQQREEYQETGWVLVEGLIPPAVIGEARQVIADVVAAAGEVTDHTDLYDLEPGHSRKAPRVRRIKVPHRNLPFFGELARLPALVEALQDLLGPGVRLHGSKINLKSPRYGSPVEWHQDWAFYPHTNDDVLAVGIMLDECTAENGAMLVVPGTHRGPTFDHHSGGRFCGAMDPARDGIDLSRAVPVTGPAGAVSLHHARLVHGSAQNFSDKPRVLLLYEYAAADAWPLLGVKDFDEFNERLVTGQPSVTPRLESVPVRLPLPPAAHQGSIYENQTAAAQRYFEHRVPA